MKVAFVIACLIAAATGAQFMTKTKSHMDYVWEEWKAKYEPKYNDEDEDSMRRAIWENNLAKIDRHNEEKRQGKYSYTLAMNHFGDKTIQELNSMMLGLMPNNREVPDEYHVPGVESLPTTVDWRKSGWVTRVETQGNCHSCWAFSANGALEGQHAKKSGKSAIALSAQNLVDCTGKFGNRGCGGGWPSNAFKYIQSNRGVDTESSYPYEEKDCTCRYNSANVGATCKGYVSTRSGNESALQSAVANVGPISVLMNVLDDFYYYSGGVYDNWFCDPHNLNHAVLAIGYGKEREKEYWLVKNSWGTEWGEDGYFRIRRNRWNQCGIASVGVYPLV